MSDTQRAIGLALVHLSAARDLLKVVKAKGATAKVQAQSLPRKSNWRQRNERTDFPQP